MEVITSQLASIWCMGQCKAMICGASRWELPVSLGETKLFKKRTHPREAGEIARERKATEFLNEQV
jgi:hypothetical protein